VLRVSDPVFRLSIREQLALGKAKRPEAVALERVTLFPLMSIEVKFPRIGGKGPGIVKVPPTVKVMELGPVFAFAFRRACRKEPAVGVVLSPLSVVVVTV
jgi:hypothetical protein